jgi:predicted transcriptional regulator
MKRLYIDFDGVVVDTIPLLYKELDKNGVSLGNEEEIRRVFGAFDFRKIIKDKNILNDSINCINKVMESGRFEISFLSHVNSLEEGIVKIKYLRRHFKDNITIILVPRGVSKTKMIHSEGAILIDDYAGNLREWKEAGGIPVRFSKEMESHGYMVVDRIDKILDLFDENGEVKC